ncbi:hypothetical protein Q5692_09315 [Microcoleus sp. C2C3]|uniref:hypothetical protein n=1 Tax=unclassified Microcoleus TaxID=2642155 RepID=UPI002FD42A85
MIWHPESRTCYASPDSRSGNSIAGWGRSTSGDFSIGKAGLLDFDTEGIFGRFGDRALAHFLLSFRPGDFSIGSRARTTRGEFSLRATR